MRLRVKDLMSKTIRSISPDISAVEAMTLLIKNNASGFPVIDKEGVALGVFTEKEILRAVFPTYLKDIGDFVYEEGTKAALKKITQLREIKVRDIMRKEFPTLNEEASLSEASRIMITKNERRIIIARDNKVVGIITRYDVVKGLAKEAGITI